MKTYLVIFKNVDGRPCAWAHGKDSTNCMEAAHLIWKQHASAAGDVAGVIETYEVVGSQSKLIDKEDLT